ncbi:hypothetical protein TNCV_4299211 [Trichonephila clavipes]|nr:hypothetical protein TNCV_4299211 [Trichonephila clavipes]
MRARTYCAQPSIRDHWALRCMSRCPDQVVSLKRDPQCLSPQATPDHAGLEREDIYSSPLLVYDFLRTLGLMDLKYICG